MIDIKWTKWKRLDKLVTKVGEMDNQFTSYGYFAEQGVHPESNGLTYAALMYIHEFREDDIPARPVFQTALRTNKQSFIDFNTKSIKTYIDSAAIGRGKSIRSLLDVIAQNGIRITKPVFGDSTLLAPNSLGVIKSKGRNSPMVDMGILKESIAFKTSLRKKAKVM